MSTSFDRLRPRTSQPAHEDPVPSAPRDTEGTRVLFSSAGPARRAGGLSVECSSCGQVKPVSLLTAVRLAVPSVHLPLLRRNHWSWMRCPSCGRRTWVRLRVIV